MTLTPSTMLELGTRAPDFTLEDQNPRTDQGEVSLKDVKGENGTLVVFLCRHCPYVKAIEDTLADVAARLQDDGIGVVGISSNDPDAYPDDDPDGMRKQAQTVGFPFPYLFDETQQVAQAYTAACTPDVFLFDADLELFYRGQFDAARPGNDIEPTGEDLLAAAEALLEGQAPPKEQVPSQGCNIKWRPGNAPAYFA